MVRVPLVLAAVALVGSAFLFSFALASRGEGEGLFVEAAGSPYRGSLSPHVPLPDFALHDQFGRLTRLEDFRGKPLVIAFVYALCPDVCPRAAATIASALDRLGPDAERLNVIAITVQPETDTRARVVEFSRRFGLLHRWRYLIDPPQDVHAVLEAFGIAPERHRRPPSAAAAAGTETAKLAHFDPADPYGAHSALVVLADAELYWVVSWPQSAMTTADLVHDLRLLLRGAPARAPTA
jgi:protein SCO1/2